MANTSGTVRRNAAETTARLIAAARAEFAERGYDGARIDRISTASGLNRALLFQRFGDKEGLYRAVLTEVAEEAARSRSALVATASPPRTRDEFAGVLRELTRATADFLRLHPEAARILAWERASGWAAFTAVHVEADDGGARAILSWFRDAGERGWLRSESDGDRQVRLVLELVTALSGEDPEFIVAAVAAALLNQPEQR